MHNNIIHNFTSKLKSFEVGCSAKSQRRLNATETFTSKLKKIELKIGSTLVTPALGNVHTNFGFSMPLYF